MKDFDNLDLIGEKQYQNTIKKLRKIAYTIIIVGISLLVISFIGFIISKISYNKQYNKWYDGWWYSNTKDLNDMPRRYYIVFVVLMFLSIIPITGGIVLLVSTYKRNIIAYNVNTVGPIVGEVHDDYVKPFVEESGTTIGKAYNNFKKETGNNLKKEVIKIKCPKCGKLNEEDAKFCNNCGNML